jgi:hypothetical protein
MIRRPPSVAGSSQAVVPLQFEDFAVSWAGQGCYEGEFCFGSEDGRLLFTTTEGKPHCETERGDDNDEAVNGMAFSDGMIAVSTRRAITCWTPSKEGDTEWQQVGFPYGSHGVSALCGGRIIAPLGPTGIMIASVTDAEPFSMTARLIREPGRTIDYYKVIAHESDERDIFVCAARSAGLSVIQLPRGSNTGQMDSITFPGLDIVDVCWIATAPEPPALAALGRDGTLVFFQDILRDRSPLPMTFHDFKGTAYRVFGAQGSTFVLTSAALYIFDGLANRFLSEEDIAHSATPGRTIDLVAVDANVCDERWLLVVMPDGVLRFDLRLLLAENHAGPTSVREERSLLTRITVTPSWQSSSQAAELIANS